MSLKLKLFSLTDAYASPKLIGSCECVEGDTQNSYHYLNVFILWVGPFNSLILRVDA